MERLTYKAGSNCGFVWGIKIPRYSMQEAIDRLAAYEDTWLAPEMIEYHAKLLSKYQHIGSIEHFQKLVDAEKAGWLVMLPCKVGDEAFVLYYDKDGYLVGTVCAISVDYRNKICIDVKFKFENGYNDYIVNYDSDDIGTRVYFSQEEAEDALRKEDEHG